ncbi:response regulator [Parapedobacter sp. DT-150]|uniref:response regulator n=1 Tax=Parapedobacter sp. DT-150 TaxID=3396162 RepID=UPI003F194324
MKNKLLYIEDDLDVSALITEIMEYEQYEVITDNGKSMFKILRENKVGLILLDQRLFWTTGSQLCMELKASPETKDIPVIMISASPNIAHISKTCGAVGYIRKPFDMYDAIAMVAKHFRE